MKLKKIVSLALAGVLAVSMLAGCSNNGSNNNSSSSSESTTTVGAAAAMNAVQNIIEFKDGSSTELAAAVKKATYTEVNGASDIAAATIATKGEVYSAVDDLLAVKYNLADTTTLTAFAGDKGETNMKTYLYLVDDTVSEEFAVSYIAKSLTKTAANYPDVVGTSPKYYEADYTGEVSVQKVTKTEANGTKTASAYYILVTVTQTVGDTAVTVGQ